MIELLQAASDDKKPEIYVIKSASQKKSIQEKDPVNYFEVSDSKAQPLDNKLNRKKVLFYAKYLREVKTDEMTILHKRLMN